MAYTDNICQRDRGKKRRLPARGELKTQWYNWTTDCELTRCLKCRPSAETGRFSEKDKNLQITKKWRRTAIKKGESVQTKTLLFFLWHCKTLSVHYSRLKITALKAIVPKLVCVKLTSSSLEVWQWGNEDLVKEQRAAIHFDGTW